MATSLNAAVAVFLLWGTCAVAQADLDYGLDGCELRYVAENGDDMRQEAWLCDNGWRAVRKLSTFPTSTLVYDANHRMTGSRSDLGLTVLVKEAGALVTYETLVDQKAIVSRRVEVVHMSGGVFPASSSISISLDDTFNLCGLEIAEFSAVETKQMDMFGSVYVQETTGVGYFIKGSPVKFVVDATLTNNLSDELPLPVLTAIYDARDGGIGCVS